MPQLFIYCNNQCDMYIHVASSHGEIFDLFLAQPNLKDRIKKERPTTYTQNEYSAYWNGQALADSHKTRSTLSPKSSSQENFQTKNHGNQVVGAHRSHRKDRHAFSSPPPPPIVPCLVPKKRKNWFFFWGPSEYAYFLNYGLALWGRQFFLIIHPPTHAKNLWFEKHLLFCVIGQDHHFFWKNVVAF